MMKVLNKLFIGFYAIYSVIIFCGLSYSQPMSGNYTVGGNSPDFVTLQDAADAAMSNGVTGPVDFNIRPGTYMKDGGATTLLWINSSIVGASEVNKITFQSDISSGGNVDNVILQADFDSSSIYYMKYLVEIQTDYISFKNLSFRDADSMDTPASNLIYIEPYFQHPPIKDIIIDGCRFIGTPYFTQGSNGEFGTATGINGNTVSTASVTNSQFSNLNLAVNFIHNPGTGDTVIVNNNRFESLFPVSSNTGAVNGGAIITNLAYVFIQRNFVTSSYGRNAIQVESPSIGIIKSNYISGNFWSGQLFISGTNVTDSLIISNNIIIGGADYGAMYIETRNTRILHNTIINARSSGATLNISGSQCTLLNNIVLAFNNDLTLVTNNSATGFLSNHNVFYKSGTQGWFARIGGIYYTTFDDYRFATGLDSNSNFTNVNFEFDSLGIHISECQAQDPVLNGIHLPEVPVDFYGAIRDSVKPFIGAVEGVRLPFDMFGDPYRAGLGGFATSIAQGKFDNSSAPGIAVPDYDNNAVYLFHNNGASRTFTQYTTLFPGFQPTDVYFYDLDDDGNLDLIIAGEEAKIEVRWGDGAGNFSNPTTLETLGRVRSIHSGHQNIDNLNTILLMEDNSFLPNSSFLGYLDNSNGRNLEHLIVQIPFTHDPDTIYAGITDFATGDLDGNGTDEVVAPGIFGSTNVQPEIVVLSDTSLGNYPWAHQNIYPGIPSASYTNSSVTLGDFDGDGDNDFITNGWDDNYCVLIKNEGGFSFAADTIPAAASRGLVKLDYENDGDLDFVTINNTLDSVGITVFLNDGSGNFEEKRNCFLPFASGQPFGVVAADFDEDGSTDIAMVSRSFGPLDSLFVLYNLGGFNVPTGIKTNRRSTEIPEKFELSQNYPNPFNPSTKINFSLPNESNVKIFIYNILGERVKELVNGRVSAGEHIINFNAGNFASGIYIYQMIAETISGNTLYTTAKKMILMK